MECSIFAFRKFDLNKQFCKKVLIDNTIKTLVKEHLR